MFKRKPGCDDCRLCEGQKCSHTGKKCGYIHKQYGMNKWVFRMITFTIFVGAIVPFWAKAVCTVWFPDVGLGLNVWNQFVSIILGITATILSIVSIIMGFKNYEDTLSVQEKYMQALQEISKIAQDITNVKNDVNKMTSMRNIIPIASQSQVSVEWDKDTPDDATPPPSTPSDGPSNQ